MIEQHFSTSEIRSLNRNKVYSFIYSQKVVSKQMIAQSLQMSMPTVTQYCKELQQMKMIEKNGFFESSGGRKADKITCIKNARIAIGVEILKDHFHLAAVNLYGEIIKEISHEVLYKNVEEYYQCLGKYIDLFIDSLPFTPDRILGIGISLQGLVSLKWDEVVWGKIMDNTGVNREDFAPYIKWPFMLIHDAEAAAFAEIWHQDEANNALYLSLNRHLGSAIIINKHIYCGENFRSSTIEHMCLVENGRSCYCGKKGCLETYCSTSALEREAGTNLENFFDQVRANNSKQSIIWNKYLSYLSLAISNSLSILDVNIIIGGLLLAYMNQEDIYLLEDLIKQRHPFPLENLNITFGKNKDKATKIGSALYYIDPFLQLV